nr:hypothetical protein [Cupriavidus necator]
MPISASRWRAGWDPTLSDAERNQAVRLNPVAMFFGVLWERVKRWFGAR